MESRAPVAPAVPVKSIDVSGVVFAAAPAAPAVSISTGNDLSLEATIPVTLADPEETECTTVSIYM